MAGPSFVKGPAAPWARLGLARMLAAAWPPRSAPSLGGAPLGGGSTSPEICNGVDDDCDGTTDEGADISCFDGLLCHGRRCISGSCRTQDYDSCDVTDNSRSCTVAACTNLQLPTPAGGRKTVNFLGCQRILDDQSCQDTCACDGVDFCSATGPTPTGCLPGGNPCNQDRDLCTIEACCEADGDYSDCDLGDATQAIQAVCERVQDSGRLSRRLLYTEVLSNGQEAQCVRKARIKRPVVGRGELTYTVTSCDDGNQCTADGICNRRTGNCPSSTPLPRGTICTADRFGNEVQPPASACAVVRCNGGRDVSNTVPVVNDCGLVFPADVSLPVSCPEIDTGVTIDGALSLYRLATARVPAVASYEFRNSLGAPIPGRVNSCLNVACTRTDGDCNVVPAQPDGPSGQNSQCPDPQGECLVGGCVADESEWLVGPDGVPVVGCQAMLSDEVCGQVTCSDGSTRPSVCQPSSGTCSDPCLLVP